MELVVGGFIIISGLAIVGSLPIHALLGRSQRRLVRMVAQIPPEPLYFTQGGHMKGLARGKSV